MQVLEKILEEIEEVEKKFVVGHEVLFALGATGLASEIEEIIRNHIDHNGENTEMVDWIPVEERLPSEFDEDNDGIITVETTSVLENGERATFIDDYDLNTKEFLTPYKVVAWRKRPEPYKPKKQD